jgi:hypothetical protein
VTAFLWSLLAVVVLVIAGLAAYQFKKRRRQPLRVPVSASAAGSSEYKISYAPSDMEWSGSTTGTLPLKTLTYKQYECLEDARYGFRIIGVKPSERKDSQPHKTRAHGLKTVASLARHGFLISNDTECGHVITDLGLNALEVCDVRY